MAVPLKHTWHPGNHIFIKPIPWAGVLKHFYWANIQKRVKLLLWLVNLFSKC